MGAMATIVNNFLAEAASLRPHRSLGKKPPAVFAKNAV